MPHRNHLTHSECSKLWALLYFNYCFFYFLSYMVFLCEQKTNRAFRCIAKLCAWIKIRALMCVKRLNSLIECSAFFRRLSCCSCCNYTYEICHEQLQRLENKSCFVNWKKEHFTWNAVSFDKQSNRFQWHSQVWMIKKQRQRWRWRRRRQENEKNRQPFAMQSYRLEIIRYLEIVSVCRWIFFLQFSKEKTLNRKNICSLI